MPKQGALSIRVSFFVLQIFSVSPCRSRPIEQAREKAKEAKRMENDQQRGTLPCNVYRKQLWSLEWSVVNISPLSLAPRNRFTHLVVFSFSTWLVHPLPSLSLFLSVLLLSTEKPKKKLGDGGRASMQHEKKKKNSTPIDRETPTSSALQFTHESSSSRSRERVKSYRLELVPPSTTVGCKK
jgi:hypothetical protein